MRKALFQEQTSDSVLCRLCPHNCRIPNGKTGLCRVRENNKGSLAVPYYGVLSAVSMDPIEKKPLYHYHPGSEILSIGFFGCNFRCPFCQNFSISQNVTTDLRFTSPDRLVDMAIAENSFGIAYTYSEPLVHFEYVRDVSLLAHSRGIKNVLVTNGYVNAGPAQDLLENIDAANIDLKSFSEEFYRKEIGGGLQPVLDFIKLAADSIHIEVTTLIIPGKNDSPEEVEAIAAFLASIRKDIPYHLSCYYPRYKYRVRQTTVDDILPLVQAASKHLTYVYAGNTGTTNSTYCGGCGELVAERVGYTIKLQGVENGICMKCGTEVFRS